MTIFEELKRRNVFRVAGVYAVVAWLLVHVVIAIETPLSLPAWTDTLVIVLFAVGVEFDPDAWLAKLRGGTPESELLKIDPAGAVSPIKGAIMEMQG